MARRALIAALVLFGVACTEVPQRRPEVQFIRLGDPLGPTLDGAVAAVVQTDVRRDTVCLWEAPWAGLSRKHALRAGDAGDAQIGEEWQGFDVLKVWTQEDWMGPVQRSVQRGAFSDSLWLAAVYGADGVRLSLGSGCWGLRVDSLRSIPLVKSDVLTIAWSQSPVFDDGHSSGSGREFEMAFRWGDEDQVLPVFWRAIERWGAPAEWELVCPCKEAFGVQGIPALGLPAHTPVFFKARISR